MPYIKFIVIHEKYKNSVVSPFNISHCSEVAWRTELGRPEKNKKLAPLKTMGKISLF